MSVQEPKIAAPSSREPLPLCVELDGALAHSHLSLEVLLSVLKRKPWLLFHVVYWSLVGQARLKDELASLGDVDVTVLPYNGEVLELVKAARDEGRRTILVTASHRKFALRVNEHLGLFDEVLASEASCNLAGSRKADLLTRTFGAGGFEYVASGRAEPAAWRSAASIVTVNAPSALVREFAGAGKPHRDLPARRALARSWLKAMRLHQWAKNALLFVPVVTAHAVIDWPALIRVGIAFLCFGLCASATYMINDLLDLDADRHHKRKRSRPFAAGQIPVGAGIAGCAAMLAAGLGLAMLLPGPFRLALSAYIVATLLYSFRLKRVASLDVLALAGLYTLRVVAGAFAAMVILSFWLLAFSMFIFLCLALVKRVAELLDLRARQQLGSAAPGKARGREYKVEDIPILQNLGAASGYMAVLVLALYINSPEVARLYQTPELLWLIAPLMLLWVTRLWVVTTRGYMDEDPILFAVKDPETWVTAGITAAILVGATVLVW